MSHKSTNTRLKLLRKLRGSDGLSPLTPDQIIAVDNAFQRVKGFYRDLLRRRHGEGRSVGELAAMMSSPKANIIAWETLALADYRLKLIDAGLLAKEKKSKNHNSKTARPPKPKVSTSFSCPQCQTPVRLPARRDAKTSCPQCACRLRVVRDKTRGMSVEILNPENITRPERETPLTISQCYELLEVSPADPLPIIKKAYLAQIQQYHPDKVHHLGPKLKAVAEEMSKNLNHAWNTIQSARVTATTP